MKLVQKILVHLVIIFVVVLLPVFVFTFMSNHGYDDFAFIGGITYFIYAFYLVFKIKNQRSKIILLGVLSSVTMLSIGIMLIDFNEFIFLIVVAINLIFHAFLLIKNPKTTNEAVWKSYLISFVLILILSLFSLCFWFLMMAASGMPSNHY
jgi:hypothetical protein